MTIVIHAGMPKTGSTSIQHWLRVNSSALREQGFTVVVSRKGEKEIVFRPHEEGSEVTSGWIVGSAVGRPSAAQEDLAEALARALATAAERYGDIVVSSEWFGVLFHGSAAPVLPALERLSAAHEVRVAYYARPQHSALEAFWRQKGYQTGAEPSEFVARRAISLHYASTRERVHSLAPGLRFEPRPFRRDLLERGDVVADFASRFLGIEAAKTAWANPGLPLEVVNVLRASPPGLFWGGRVGAQRLTRIKQLLASCQLPEDERTVLSRKVLRKYAYERYAAENAELGWEDFIPPPEEGVDIPGIEALDELWVPKASPTELSLLFRALDAAV